MKSIPRSNLWLASAVLTGILFVNTCQAAQIQGVTVSAFSGQFTNPPDNRFAANIVSNIGLFGDTHVNVGAGAMWFATNGQSATNFVTFNLGGLYTVNAMKVWNYNESANNVRGVQTANISYSTDGVNFTTNIVAQVFTMAPGTWSAFGQVIQMPSPVVAQYMRINVITNWATSANGVGLSKVRFISSTNLPTVLTASENYGSNQITVVFSESVDPNSATNLVNYSITGGGSPTISNVTLGEYADRVVLHTSPLTSSGYSIVVSGVYDEALTATVANNSTVPVQSEGFLWLMANQGVQTNATGTLTAWNDQSPFGHNAGPTNIFQYNTQPYFAANIQNGQPAVQFFGTNLMAIPNDPNNPIDGDMTLIMVLSVASTSASAGDPLSKTGGLSAANANNLPAPWDFQLTKSTSRPQFIIGNGNGGTGPSTVTAGPGLALNTFYIVAAQLSTNIGSIYTNGYILASAQCTAAPWDAGNPIFMGVRDDGIGSSGNVTFNGNLAEAMIIRGSMTPNDFANVHAYLSTKYNIPLNTISIVEQPAGLTAQVGQQATFWVNATGMPGLAYQWQSNNVNISGATGAVYTTPPLTLAADGASYTVTISTAIATTTSSTATLSVVPDTTPPVVASVTKTTGLTNVLVVFSKIIGNATALNAANYAINGGVSVLSAAVGASTNEVILTTSGLSATNSYTIMVQNVTDLDGNTMATTNVLIMPAGLTMWLRGDSGVVTNSAASNPGWVDEWLDQSGNNNNAVSYILLGGTTARPSLNNDSVNQQPAIFFTAASSQYLSVANSPGIALTGDMTIYAVANIIDYSAYRPILGKCPTNVGQPMSYDLNTLTGGSGKLRYLRGNGQSSGLATASANGAIGTPQVVAVTSSGATMTEFLNGTADGSANNTFPTLDSGLPLYIGSRTSHDVFMNGDIAEILLFSNAISGTDRTNIDNYLGAKYFTFTVTKAPQNVVTNVGSTVTFSVGASQGSAHLTYQWIENSTNILNATNTSYTTRALTPADNGDTFSVVVTVQGLSTNLIGPVTITLNNVPPTVVSVGTPFWNTASNIIVVVFSEAVSPTTGLNILDYTLDNGASVLGATYGSASNIVFLTTSPLAPGTSYTLTVQHVQDLFTNTIVSTNVPDGVYPPDLALWIRADNGVMADSGNNVYQWNDLSTNGNNFFTAGNSPLFVPNAINGLPAVQFNGTNETYLYANDAPSLDISGDITIFAVANFTTYDTNGIGFKQGGGEIISKTGVGANVNQPGPYDYYVSSPNGPLRFLRGNGTPSGLGADNGDAAVTPSTGVPHVLDVVMQGTTMTHRLDGAANGVDTWATPTADAGQPVYIGTRGDGALRLTGDLAEIVVVASALSSNDTVSVENYLAAKYGLLAPPSLSVMQSDGNVLVSWPTQQWLYDLQSTPRLNPAAWIIVTNTPVVTNGTTIVTIPIGASNSFYRLQSQ